MTRLLHSRSAIHIAVVAAYAALAVVCTWPLVAQLGTHVPGSATWAFDEYTFLWNSWWLRYSALDLGQSPLVSTHTFYPLGISLALYTYNLFNALVSLPLQPFLSLPAISNLTFLFATVLSAYGTFLLTRYLLTPRDGEQAAGSPQRAPVRLLAAFLAGLVYAFGSYRMVYAAIGHYDMWSTEWVPFYALFFIKTIREPAWRNAVLAGLFLALAMLCEMILGVFLAMLSLILLLFALARREGAGGTRRLAGRLALVAGVAVLLYLPVLVPVLAEMFGGYELSGWGDAQKLSVDLLGFVTPTALHPLGGDWETALRQAREGTARFSDVNTVFLGWASLTLALAGAIRYRKQVAAWIVSAVTFAVLAMGPLLQINGRSVFDLDGLSVSVPLPFILLHYIPLVKANRVPNRFSVVLMLALAVLAAYGAYWLLGALLRRLEAAGGRRRAGQAVTVAGCALLAVLVLFEHWSVPLPLTDARIPPVYAQVAAEPDDFAILQLPLGWRNSFGQMGAEDTQKQYYQSYHHKRLLSGNISRNPPFKFDYFRQIPILDSLITLETYGQVDDARRSADRVAAGEFVSFYDIRYVVVAPGVPGRPPYVDTRDEAVAYVEEVLPVTKIEDRDGWLLYRVDQAAPANVVEVDFGGGGLALMAVGEGWAAAESVQGVSANWAVAQGAQVFLPGATGQGYRLSVTALPFEGAGAQEMSVLVNGSPLPEPAALGAGWNDLAWDVPAGLVHDGLNDVRFQFAHLAAPADVLPDNGAIGGTGVQAPLAIEVNSDAPAGFAYITVGEGEEAVDGSLHAAGYNVAVVDARTGRLIERQAFDTTPTGSDAQAQNLADYLAGVRPGQIVVVAMQGDGAARLSAAAVEALRGIGAQADPQGTTGWSHAIIGVKGAAPGSALEAAGPQAGWLRVAPDRRTLAVAVDRIRWEPIEPAGPVP